MGAVSDVNSRPLVPGEWTHRAAVGQRKAWGHRDWAWFLGTTRFCECDAAPFAMWRSLADRTISRRQGRSFTGTGKSYMEICGTVPGIRVERHPAAQYWTHARGAVNAIRYNVTGPLPATLASSVQMGLSLSKDEKIGQDYCC